MRGFKLAAPLPRSLPQDDVSQIFHQRRFRLLTLGVKNFPDFRGMGRLNLSNAFESHVTVADGAGKRKDVLQAFADLPGFLGGEIGPEGGKALDQSPDCDAQIMNSFLIPALDGACTLKHYAINLAEKKAGGKISLQFVYHRIAD